MGIILEGLEINVPSSIENPEQMSSGLNTPFLNYVVSTFGKILPNMVQSRFSDCANTVSDFKGTSPPKFSRLLNFIILIIDRPQENK